MFRFESSSPGASSDAFYACINRGGNHPFTDVCFRCGRGHRTLIVMVGETGGDAEERAAETIGAKA